MYVCVCVCVCVCVYVCVCVCVLHTQPAKQGTCSIFVASQRTHMYNGYICNFFFKKKVYVTFLCYICTTDTYVSATDTYVDINTYVDVDFNTYTHTTYPASEVCVCVCVCVCT